MVHQSSSPACDNGLAGCIQGGEGAHGGGWVQIPSAAIRFRSRLRIGEFSLFSCCSLFHILGRCVLHNRRVKSPHLLDISGQSRNSISVVLDIFFQYTNALSPDPHLILESRNLGFDLFWQGSFPFPHLLLENRNLASHQLLKGSIPFPLCPNIFDHGSQNPPCDGGDDPERLCYHPFWSLSPLASTLEDEARESSCRRRLHCPPSKAILPLIHPATPQMMPVSICVDAERRFGSDDERKKAAASYSFTTIIFSIVCKCTNLVMKRTQYRIFEWALAAVIRVSGDGHQEMIPEFGTGPNAEYNARGLLILDCRLLYFLVIPSSSQSSVFLPKPYLWFRYLTLQLRCHFRLCSARRGLGDFDLLK
ncbi:hypothetical protein KSP40_PGU014356 [Platanthera guangdongensis]|uniref:Uncharacterized protein n=1 Tax=Platanthera guangdongensis TaxID=2320717 RepID=A0ABR2M7V1_9ASPA